MANLPQQESSAPLTGGIVAVVVVVFGLFAISQGPLKSARPLPSPSPWDIAVSEANLPARLWQDPFQVVQEYLSRSPEKLLVLIDNEEQSTINLAEQSSGKLGASDEELDKDKESSDKTSNLGTQSLQAAFEKQCREMGSITVMISMVFGGNYHEIKEGRIRARYATLTALANKSFVPADPQHIGFFQAQLLDSKTQNTQRKRFNVPYEWLEPTNREEIEQAKRRALLLLWVEDEHFNTRPLQLLNALVEQVKEIATTSSSSNTPQKTEATLTSNACLGKILEFRIIGPAGSTTLKAMIDEALDLISNENSVKPSHLEKTEIYSPSATASGSDWLAFPTQQNFEIFIDHRQAECSSLSSPDGQSNEEDSEVKPLFCEFKKELKLGIEEQHSNIDRLFNKAITSRFVSTILPDRLLMDALVEELDLRTRDLCSSPIAIVSEWDTHYARDLPESFRKALESLFSSDTRFSKPGKEDACLDSLESNIYRYSYIRGIDGQLPDSTEYSSSQPDYEGAESQKDDEFSPKRAKRRRSSGNSQYDYLQRMAVSLERKGEVLSHSKLLLPPGGFVAIGVLGSDVYDKLLIMQALNVRFPNALFFTTDIDASYWHPAEIPHTRNLLIASSYGLEVNNTYYSPGVGGPPFRDGYQASRYMAAYEVASQKNPESDESPRFVTLTKEMQARLFEVGRTGPVHLRLESGDTRATCEGSIKLSCVNDPTVDSGLQLISPKGIVLIMVVVLSLFFLLLYLYFYKIRAQLDPHSGYAGMISALLLMGVLTLLVFIWAVLKVEEPFAWLEGVSLWPSYFVRLSAGALAMIFFFIVRINVTKCDAKLLELFDVNDLEKDNDDIPKFHFIMRFSYPNDLKDLSDKYKCYSCPRERMRRVLILWGTYFLLAYSLMLALGFPHVPLRSSHQWIDPVITIVFSVTPMLILLFFVLDSTKLATWLARCLSRQETPWPEKAFTKYQAGFGTTVENGSKLPGTETNHGSIKSGTVSPALWDWLSLKVIARHSEIYGNLVHFPALVLLLMIFARFSYFDDLPFSPGLVIVLLIAWSYLVFCAVSLRKSAEAARATSLSRLEARMAIAKGQSAAPTVDQLEYAMDNIRTLKTGAFRPLTQQPWFRALAYLFGGGGSLILLEYMVWVG